MSARLPVLGPHDVPGIYHDGPLGLYYVRERGSVYITSDYSEALAYWQRGPAPLPTRTPPYPARKPERGELVSETDLRLLAQSCPPQFHGRLREAAKRRYPDPYTALMGMIDWWEATL